MTPWYAYFLQFVGGMLVTNGVPHFVHGVSGAPFQSPFARPPGIGESPPLVNVYWGFANLAGGALLVWRFAPDRWIGWVVVAAGALFAGTFLAIRLGKLRRRA
jgi:hypothetical protein